MQTIIESDIERDMDIFNEENITAKTTNKLGRRRYYPSNKQETAIRNAVTGIKYPYLVGSVDQKRLYKIVDATGTCNPDGYVIKSKYDLPNHATNHLFYDSPEQCMSHLKISIQPDSIASWRANVTSTIPSPSM
jgi:hypothetical protein